MSLPTASAVFEEEVSYNTNVIQFEDGGEVRNSYGTVRRIFTLNYDRITKANRDLIVADYESQYGQYDTFSFTNPNDNTAYTVRYLEGSLEEEETGYEIYNINLKLIEII